MNKAIIKIVIVFILFFCFSDNVSCQINTPEIKINYLDKLPEKVFKKLVDDFKNDILLYDSIKIIQNINQLQLDLYEQGYLEASIDKIEWGDSTLNLIIFVGNIYQGLEIYNSNLDEKLLNTIGMNKSSFENKKISPSRLKSLSSKILSHFENSGFPFASAQLSNVVFDDNILKAELLVKKNILVTIDSVVIKGKSKINSNYLYNYLGIRPGDIYNESVIRKIPFRIKELNFVDFENETQIYFRKDKARIYLYLVDRKVSAVDGILGLQSDKESGKLDLTGEVKLFLSNSFSRGEKLKFHWKQPRSLTQNLDIEVNIPFVLSTPFGLDAQLEIYKADTTYLDLKQLLGVQYIFTGNNYLEAFVQYHNSSLLSTENFSNLTTLPEWADISSTNYGLKLNIEKIDYKFNPRKGLLADIKIAVGTKTIEKNSKLNPELYDSLELKTTQYDAQIKANYFITLYKRNVVNIGTNSALFITDDIFDNQLYRIGGLNSLRGFDEESILASAYAIFTVEYRYLLEENAYFMLFANGGYYELNGKDKFVSDTPFGFGTGIAFETKLGIFNLNYALGQQFNNPIFFRDAKLHFGITNYF